MLTNYIETHLRQNELARRQDKGTHYEAAIISGARILGSYNIRSKEKIK